MPGPPPKSNAQRRRRNAPRANTTKLPAEGRRGPVPAWPLETGQPEGWAELWSMPQAVMWEKQRVTTLVARYLFLRDAVARPDSPQAQTASFWSELSKLEDRLGLSPMAMMRLQWEIDGTTVDDTEDQDDEAHRKGGSADVIAIRNRVAGNPG